MTQGLRTSEGTAQFGDEMSAPNHPTFQIILSSLRATKESPISDQKLTDVSYNAGSFWDEQEQPPMPVLDSHIYTRLQNLGGCAAKAFHLGFVMWKAASEIKMSSTLMCWPVVDVDSLNNLSYLGWGWLSS